MTLVIIINALLCLAVLIAIVGWQAWAIVRSHQEVLSTCARVPETVVAGLVSNEASYESRAVIQP